MRHPPRQANVSLFFTRCQFNITYLPGSRNTKADAWTRMHQQETHTPQLETPERILPPEVNISSIRWQIDEDIEKALPHIQVPNQCPPGKLYVPEQFRTQLITWAHSSVTSGHPGETRTHQLLAHRYWWQSMTQDVHSFVSSCSTCAQCKTPKTLPAGKLMPLPIPNRPCSPIAERPF